MALHHPPGVHHLLAEGRLPVAVRGHGLDLIEDGIDEAVEDVFLVPDVSVEGHRIDAELLAELAHAEGFDAAPIGEVDRGLEHALLGQGRTSLGFRSCLTHHLDRSTSILPRALTRRHRPAMFTP